MKQTNLWLERLHSEQGERVSVRLHWLDFRDWLWENQTFGHMLLSWDIESSGSEVNRMWLYSSCKSGCWNEMAWLKTGKHAFYNEISVHFWSNSQQNVDISIRLCLFIEHNWIVKIRRVVCTVCRFLSH